MHHLSTHRVKNSQKTMTDATCTAVAYCQGVGLLCCLDTTTTTHGIKRISNHFKTVEES